MSQIFELFGYPLEDQSLEAQQCRRSAWCPFMGRECDGGGNRPQSAINLKKNEALQEFFRGRSSVQAGVCSLQLTPGSGPWIVCPRRLLALNRDNGNSSYQRELDLALLNTLDYPSGTRLGVWSEVGLKFETESGDVVVEVDVEVPGNVVEEDEEGIEPSGKSFDYRFDYIIMPLKRTSILDVAQKLGITVKRTINALERGGYHVAVDHEGGYVEYFPYGHPYIIEIMTSSTSGGNQRKRTTVPMAFEDAVLGRTHTGPGINYRQVWARMVSQLIVKSEVAIGWGGRTIWVVQDTLVDYISKSTALDIHKFASGRISEVNMLSFSYRNNYQNLKGIIDLTDAELFAGPIAEGDSKPGEIFLDILRTPIKPTLDRLVQALAQKKFVNTLVVP